MAVVKKGGRFAMSLALLLLTSALSLSSASRMLELESYGSDDDGLSCNGCPINHCDEDCRPETTTACPACPQNDRRSKKGPGIGGLIPSIGFGIGEGYGVDIPGLGTVGGGFGVGVGVGKGSGSGGSTGFAQGSANGRISVPSLEVQLDLDGGLQVSPSIFSSVVSVAISSKDRQSSGWMKPEKYIK